MNRLTHGKTLQYWRDNAEEDYLKVPISVLKYIVILEEEALKQVKNNVVLGDVIECEHNAMQPIGVTDFMRCLQCGHEWRFR